jgi:hypothetical protein
VRITLFLILYICFVDRCLSFCLFSFGHCVVCSSSIYEFWLPLWYFQTLLRQNLKTVPICNIQRRDILFFCSPQPSTPTPKKKQKQKTSKQNIRKNNKKTINKQTQKQTTSMVGDHLLTSSNIIFISILVLKCDSYINNLQQCQCK